MSWTSGDDNAFAAYAANPDGYDLEQLSVLVYLLLTHKFEVGTARLQDADSYCVTLILDGWYSAREDATDMAEHWQAVVDEIRQILDRRTGR